MKYFLTLIFTLLFAANTCLCAAGKPCTNANGKNTVQTADSLQQQTTTDAMLMQEMMRLNRQNDLVGAMQCATLLLSRNEKNSHAANFMRSNWDSMIKQVQKQIEQHNDEEDIEECEARCGIYRRLAEVEDNLRGVSMPLRGNGNRWVWQPELLYTEGTYQTERQHLASLLRKKARQALLSYDAEGAQKCYDKMLNSDLLYPQEIKGNRKLLLDDCNNLLAQKAAHKNNVTDLLFAYELTTLSLFLDEQQTDIPQIQQQLTADIAHRYEQLAEKFTADGDTIRAQEYRIAAEEWKE